MTRNGNGSGVWKTIAGFVIAALITGAGAYVVLAARTPTRTDMKQADQEVERSVKEWVTTHKEANKETLNRLAEGLDEVQKEQNEMKVEQGKFQSEVHTKLDLVIEQLKKKRD